MHALPCRPLFRLLPPALVLLAMLFVWSCRTIKIDRPAENYQKISYAPGYSNISIPIETDGRTLKRMINREISGVVYADSSFDDNDHDDLMLRATVSDSISLSLDRNQISYRVPLKIWIRKRISAGFLGLDLSQTGDATAALILKFRTTVSLTNDYGINAVTSSDGYEWTQMPRLIVGQVQVPLPVIGDMIVQSNMTAISKEINNEIKKTVNFKKIIADAWIGMQKPFLISDEYKLWLKLTPSEVSSVPLGVSAFNIRHTFGIKTQVELFFGNEPGYTVNPTVPPLKITSAIPDNFNITFSIDVPLSRINDLARRQLNGYSYTYKNYSITVNDITLYGQGENLIVAMPVGGSIKGTIYLSGKPVFDKGTSSIKLENLDFSVSTKNVLVKSASWILRSGLIKKMSENLVFPFGDRLTEARNEVASYLRQSRSLGYFRITGDVQKLEADKILITPESVRAYFQMVGNIAVRLND